MCSIPPSLCDKFASELIAHDSLKSSWNDFEIVLNFSSSTMLSKKVLPNHASVTVIRFCVSVPVLSAFNCVAEPIVSHASNRLTKFWSFIICFIANANPRVIANGKPSGIATTTIVTELIKKFKTFKPSQLPDSTLSAIHRINDAKNVKIAAPIPKFPTRTTNASSRSCNGVDCGSTINVFKMAPHCECPPTATTTHLPLPSETLVPDNKNGSFSKFFPISIGSPVIAASFVFNLLPSKYTQSAGILSPAVNSNTSPTNTSPAGICSTSPSITVLTL
mmetsp:Transcript_3603/g.12071  ORF Transcript_3603/g.12071 Transcript_3603/m.12071 type:complete len:277 (-) Transcript_3603:532-1362(-)